MADITIVKFKVRRGTDSERERVVLDQGEIGYTIDTKRLFVEGFQINQISILKIK